MNEQQTIEVIQQTVDLSEVVEILNTNNMMLEDIILKIGQITNVQSMVYTLLLFVTGCAGAFIVCILLYKFIKQFY